MRAAEQKGILLQRVACCSRGEALESNEALATALAVLYFRSQSLLVLQNSCPLFAQAATDSGAPLDMYLHIRCVHRGSAQGGAVDLDFSGLEHVGGESLVRILSSPDGSGIMLERLNLTDCHVTADVLETLSRSVPRLSELCLSRCLKPSILRERATHTLASLGALQHLDLSMCPLLSDSVSMLGGDKGGGLCGKCSSGGEILP